MKRIISIVMTAMLMLTTVSVPAYAHNYEKQINGSEVATYDKAAVNQSAAPNGTQECGDNLTWTLADGVLTISGTGAMTEFNGEEYAPWYEYSDQIVEVVVSLGVTGIGEAAFFDMYNLEKATLADTVKKVGVGAFAYCYSLTEFTANGLTEIANYAFNLTGLTEFNVPAGVNNIASLAFAGSPIENYTVEAGNEVFSAEEGVLYKSENTVLFMYPAANTRESFEIPSTVSKVGECAFLNNIYLKEITIPSSVKKLGESAFQMCESLTTVDIPGSITVLGDYVFFGCSALEKVTLNEGVNKICAETFYGCESLKTVDIPASMKLIESEAFPETTVLNNKNTDLVPFGSNGYRRVQAIYLNVQEKYAAAFNVLKIVNQERAAKGLDPLVMNESLMQSAMLRAAECATLFSHTRPTGEDCFAANPLMFGENIAFGADTAKSVMTMWMNSPGHRTNILTKGYTTIGIGCVVQNGQYYWVQCFGCGDDKANCTKPADVTKEQKVELSLEPIADEGGIIVKPEILLDYSRINLGETMNAEVFVGLAKCKNKNISWSSSNEKVATVSSAGKVKGVGYGTATLTAKMKYYTLTAKVSVVCPGHNYITTITKATPSADGKIVKKCSVCKNTVTTKIFAPSTTKLSYSIATYNGKAKKPAVKVMNSNGKVVASKNYTVTYQTGRTKVGTYKVTVKFKNNYKGTVVKTFKIIPGATSLTTVTAKTAGMTVKWKKQAVQTNGYEICYSTASNFSNNTKVQVQGNQKISKVVNCLESGKKYYVKVRTFKNVFGTKYYSKWSAAKTVTIK